MKISPFSRVYMQTGMINTSVFKSSIWDQNNVISSSPDVKPHPSLCQLLFESQSPQLVSTGFSGRRVHVSHIKMTPLDLFATGYCIAHSDTTSSWNVQLDKTYSACTSQHLQAFSSGLHYSTTTTHVGTGSLTEMTSKLPGHHLQQCIPFKHLHLQGSSHYDELVVYDCIQYFLFRLYIGF